MTSPAAVQLAVKIIGQDGELRKALNRSEQGVGSFSRNAARVAGGAGIAFNTVAAGVTAAGTALHMISIEAAIAGREIERMAASANASVIDIQAAEYATQGLGFEQGKMADILKDVQEKLGDYVATGGGEFADFFENIAPKVGLTADELQRMSGPEALIAVKKAMDDVNVSASEQTFYLESLANDASALTPLLAENGAAYRELEADYLSMNSAMTESEIAKFKQYARDIDEMKDSFGALLREAVMPFVDELGEGARYMREIFSKARGNLLAKEINDTHTQMVNLNDEIIRFEKTGRRSLSQKDYDRALEFKRQKLAEVRAELKELQERNDQLNGKPIGPIEITGGVPRVTPGGPVGGGGKKNDELQRLQDQSARALDMMDVQFASEQQKIELNHQKRLASLETLKLSEAEISRRGFEDIEALRAEYEAKSEERRDGRLQAIKIQEEEKALADFERISQEFLTKEELEQTAWQNRQTMIDNAFQQQLISEDAFRTISLKNEKKYQDNLAKLEAKRMQDRLKNYENLFGSIADVMKVAAGEQSGIYKAMFLASKAFAIAQSIIKIQQGIAEAASLPFPANIPAIGTVVSATAGILSTIQSTSLEGMAHDGIDYVPREGTWLLQKGERVLNPDQNKIFSRLENGGGLGSGVVVNQEFNIYPDGSTEQETDSAAMQGFVERMSEVSRQTIVEEMMPGGHLEGVMHG